MFITTIFCCCSAIVGTTLTVDPENSLTNPLGRTVKVCASPSTGFLQPASGTFTATETTAQTFTKANLIDVQGFDVAMMQKVLQTSLVWDYEIHVYSTPASALYHTRVGTCDVAMGAFSHISSRVQCHAVPLSGQSWGAATGCPLYSATASATTTTDFAIAGCCIEAASPYFQTGLSVMRDLPTKYTNEILFDTMASAFVVNWLSTLLGGILLVGHIAWLLERTKETHGEEVPQFAESFTQGGHEGVWWAMVTTTTVGYGDKTVKSGIARIVTAIWMGTGFVATACVIGALASALTTPEAQDELLLPTGLTGVKTCTLSSYTENVLLYNAEVVPEGGVSMISDCYDRLKDGTVNAVVYDHQKLRAKKTVDASLKIYTIGEPFDHFNDGPFLPKDSLIYSQFQWALGKALNDDTSMTTLKNTWFPAGADAGPDTSEVISWHYLTASAVGWVVYLILQGLSLNVPVLDRWRRRNAKVNATRRAVFEFVFGTEEERQAQNEDKDYSSRCCTNRCWRSHVVAPEPDYEGAAGPGVSSPTPLIVAKAELPPNLRMERLASRLERTTPRGGLGPSSEAIGTNTIPDAIQAIPGSPDTSPEEAGSALSITSAQ